MITVLKNAAVYEDGVIRKKELLFDGASLSSFSGEDLTGDAVSYFDHALILPGFCDVHVHFREPGFSYKEDIASGTASAAHGGYTAVCTMPNLSPAPDSAENLKVQTDAIACRARIPVYPYGTITKEEQGKALSDMEALAGSVVAFSDDGRGVQSESLMREAMMQCRRLGKILAAHCEDNSLLRGGYIHDGAYARAHGHRGICSESEWGQIARDVKLAEETGCAYHVCHVSTKESVAVIRAAKRRGVDVTCETAPHYLAFTQDDLQEDGRFKMNPPLRDQADRDALIEGLLDGTIDMLITDHAPHSREEKSKGLEKSAMGVVGLETSFAASYTHLVKKGILPLEKLVELMHTSPMRRFGCGTEIAVGQPADLTVFDLNETYTVDPEAFLTMGRATPFAGTCLTGACKLTMIGGEIVWKEDTL